MIISTFLINALLAGFGIAIVAGPLGSLMIWRRMAYFGDTLAHSTLLGVCLAVFFNINIYLGLLVVCLFVSVAMLLLLKLKSLSNDTVLGVLSHSSLALGLIFSVTVSSVKINLISYLYGDILSVTNYDLVWIYLVSVIVIGLIIKFWDWLLLITMSEELALAEKIPVVAMRWLLIVLLGLVMTIVIKLVGVLLITALLIIPSSTARQISNSPEHMAITASVLGCVAVSLGVGLSLWLDWPTGPAIVASAAGLFAAAFSLKIIRRQY